MFVQSQLNIDMNKNIWKIVMLFALIGVFSGGLVSLYGILSHDEQVALIGLALVGSVCVSWWFWVMFIIKSMIKYTETTCTRLTEIKQGIKDIKNIIADQSVEDK